MPLGGALAHFIDVSRQVSGSKRVFPFFFSVMAARSQCEWWSLIYGARQWAFRVSFDRNLRGATSVLFFQFCPLFVCPRLRGSRLCKPFLDGLEASVLAVSIKNPLVGCSRTEWWSVVGAIKIA